MRLRTVAKLGMVLSVVLFCTAVGFYGFAKLSLTDKSRANIVSAYEQILISDICNISEISNSWIERDREQSNQLKESNTLLDLLEYP